MVAVAEDAALALAVARIREWAEGMLRQRFPNRPHSDPRRYWAYHNLHHSFDVAERRGRLAETICQSGYDDFSVRDVAIGEVSALFHDYDQIFEVQEVNGARKRVRPFGLSETTSAAGIMSRVDRETLIFSLTDVAEIGRSILGTAVIYDQKSKTVMHPYLGKHSAINDVLLALADVNTAGMEGPEALHRDMVNLFKEDNVDFLHWWINGRWPSDTESLRQRMIAWTQVQHDFTRGRFDRLELELGWLPEGLGGELIHHFSHFGESIEAASELAYEAQHMSFESLLELFAYTPQHLLAEGA